MGLNVIFDLDETLIDTSRLKPHRATDEGRKYVAENPSKVDTKEYSPLLKDIVKFYHSRNKASIVTNASYDYAKTLLEKHGFPTDVPIYANAKKPSTESIKKSMEYLKSSPQETLMIGDTARDILTAHQARIPSIAVTWGSTSSIEQIAQAEPTRIASDFQDLEYKIADFEEGVFNYKSRTKHRDYMMLPESQRNKILSVKIENKYLGEFCSYKKDKRDIHSNLVRAFDQSRDVSVKDIQTGCRKEYFAGGIVRQGEVFNDVLENFKDRMSRLILSFNLKGSTGIIAAPNSCPEYCYKSDPHQNLVEDVAKITGCKCRDINSEYRRVVNRVFPKVSSHTGGGRGIFNHYKTMGFSPIMDLSSLNNIVIFDNVKTTGSQIKSMAFFLYHFGFRGKFCSATLAYTSLKDFEESNI